MKHTNYLAKRFFKSRYVQIATFVVGVAIGAVLIGQLLPTVAVAPEAPREPVETGSALNESIPVSLSIPKLDLVADFEAPLGIEVSTGEIEVPEAYDTVGWYQYGPTPGELGPAVVLGHVDSTDGPAVFWSLGQLEIGDEIVVTRADQTEVIFVVTDLKRVAQAGFPTVEVYGDIDHAGIRLITCTGTYDRGERRYSHNLIVFGELREVKEQSPEAET